MNQEIETNVDYEKNHIENILAMAGEFPKKLNQNLENVFRSKIDFKKKLQKNVKKIAVFPFFFF